MSTVVPCQEALLNPVCGEKRTGVLIAAAIPRGLQTKEGESQKPSSGPSTEMTASKVLHSANDCCRGAKRSAWVPAKKR